MKTISGVKNTALIYCICNLIGWSLLTWADWREESKSRDLYEQCLIGLPVVLFILYIFFEIITNNIKEPFGQKVKYKLLWLGIGSIFGLTINFLVSKNIWIVTQDLSGWENMLNGVEYALFWIFYVGANSVAWFLFDLIVLIYGKVKNSRGS